MGSVSEDSFSAPPQVVSADGLLVDFDGTIIDSTEAIVKHWHKQGELMGVDPNVILATSHGRRSIDTFKIYDASKANWDYISHQEGLIPKEYGQNAVDIPGARKLLESLEAVNAPWAVVTSGTRALLTGWIEVLKLAHPRCVVVAEDVEEGKPHPECYLLGRQRLGLKEDARMIVIEDAPSGVRAGKAAGFKVIGLTTTHTIGQLKEAGADWIVRDLRSVSLKSFADGVVQIEITNALVSA
ncbi:DL-glycerol-3-phosphatase [Exophiala dermatitidis]|uniref:Glycerol 3-phosphatase 1 n=2 Tax=Exophiala dermatitidis TaxID=5970 RepID=H6C8J3_EXODN|nr:glycerol 3-phosphatase 1 [Exophiala dermatitidis NIH/UT8656]KAJ4523532.1 DL-glycerol-3-phosphatase [Exophiala dermatitidis]EHY60420.1 glycerol 3-phosphatase 1 [Exophiala dermatitidis NIH/UT8656]KAJ4527426.1 DL-glycerol-3-phosphatase [Exophiala dermatitidis]KAJ4530991.1 DL-glycerol-3-phosphatase [Exophiala dermatitidis]KAJ4581808.1 DL-glycerol-3-phosphatase [Exophiala dermatitidis]